MSAINFFVEDIDFKLTNKKKYKTWLYDLASEEDRKIDTLNFIFCSDDYLHSINMAYLDHDTYTDIITFPYQQGDTLEADIFISIERIVDNSKEFDVQTDKELRRVMAHGMFHLCGYNDKSDEEISMMRRKEEEAIALWSKTR